MSVVTKKCRVCGKRYEACHTPNTTNIFRWRDVACSPECGAEYLRLITLARAGVAVDTTKILTDESETFFDEAEEVCEEECEANFGSDE